MFSAVTSNKLQHYLLTGAKFFQIADSAKFHAGYVNQTFKLETVYFGDEIAQGNDIYTCDGHHISSTSEFKRLLLQKLLK